VKTQDQVLEITGAFLQYYRETAHYLERTSKWVERNGLDHIKKVLESEETRQELIDRLEQALCVLKDPWVEAIHNQKIQQELYESVNVPVELN
jgi:nitrite reductase (NADH) large subunit